jgi:hypothetical protein
MRPVLFTTMPAGRNSMSTATPIRVAPGWPCDRGGQGREGGSVVGIEGIE